MVPVLQPTLDALLALLHGPDTHELSDTVVELCLTLPARLSSILPHLPRLAHPLLRALKSTSSELQLLGLRTLEFWVDSLNPDFLDPCIAEVESDLMLALWGLLKPQQSGAPFGAKALQMLGKLGGRSRSFLREPLALDAKENPEHGLRLILTFKPETSFLVPLDRCIALMRTILAAPPVPNLKGAEALVEHRKHALAFLRACLASVLNVSGGLARSGANTVEIRAALEGVVQGWFQNADSDEGGANGAEDSSAKTRLGNKTKTQLEAEKSVFKQLLTAVVAAEADPTLKTANDGFVSSIAEHFAMLFVSGAAPLVTGGSGRSGAILAKEAAARSAAAASVLATGADDDAGDDKNAKKGKTPPPPSPKKTRGGRRGKKDDEEEGKDEDDDDKDDKDVEMKDALDDPDAVDIDTSHARYKKRKGTSASLTTLDATLFLDALMDAMESGKRPHVEAALRAVQTFIDGVMTLACDASVVGVSAEDAKDARACVAHAEACLELENKERECAAIAAKAMRDAGIDPSAVEADAADVADAAEAADADAEKAKEKDSEMNYAGDKDEDKEEDKAEMASPKQTRASRRGAATSSKKSAKTEDEDGEDADAASKDEGKMEDGDKKGDVKKEKDASIVAAAAETPVPPALDSLVAELLPRLTHMCFKKSWQSVVGGVAGIDALTRVLPATALQTHLPRILQALLYVFPNYHISPTDCPYETDTFFFISQTRAALAPRARRGGGAPRDADFPPRVGKRHPGRYHASRQRRAPKAGARHQRARRGALLHVVVAHGAAGCGKSGGGPGEALRRGRWICSGRQGCARRRFAFAPAAHAARPGPGPGGTDSRFLSFHQTRTADQDPRVFRGVASRSAGVRGNRRRQPRRFGRENRAR